MGCAACGVVNDAGSQVLQGVRRAAVSHLPGLRRDERPGRQVLRRVRVGARRGSARRRVGAAPSPTKDGDTERRVVSVLFVDLVGFTTLAEGRDAEDVRTHADAATSTPPPTPCSATAAPSRSSSVTP